MAPPVEVAAVRLWDLEVGAVAWDSRREVGVFEYAEDFLRRELDLSPLHMSLADARRREVRFSFPALPRDTFLGLPGLLADSLPDHYGHALIDAWLARQGRNEFNPVERLCYTGRRAMGALEFEPALRPTLEQAVPVQVADLVELAGEVLTRRAALDSRLDENEDALLEILRVGTSAGGARPKAVIALNDETGEVLSGQVAAPPGFGYWILKFDGVKDESLGDPEGYGRIEYAYHLLARTAGVEMAECRLHQEGGRAHFLTRRFDRTADGERLHMQSLCGLAHLDYRAPGAHSYEQAFGVLRRLRAPYPDTEQLFRRLVFNAAACNLDDHTKNISFLMDRAGQWRLAPAFDVTFSYKPDSRWVSRHQMTIGGKRDDIRRDDLLALAHEVGVKKPADILAETAAALNQWPACADEAGVPRERRDAIAAAHRPGILD